MLKKFLMLITLLYAAVSFAAVDVNQASAADLDGIKGIGPTISGKMLNERKKGNFKDWNDFIARVNGLGEKNAAKFSAQGLTVNGSAYSGAPAAKASDKTAKGKLTTDSKAAASAAKSASEKEAAVTAPGAAGPAKK
ncbi:ComEA family DNA-binding protein [Simplicispira psychrophila]|uniref:ComEA family DNA-binding protein n=1 Tax=Simplicispira psychrophila TaxID=80882 RepID=UPI00047F9AEF|nr:helix-hairpin-helix domain-containing protein [Simplicispira psychrophila]